MARPSGPGGRSTSSQLCDAAAGDANQAYACERDAGRDKHVLAPQSEWRRQIRHKARYHEPLVQVEPESVEHPDLGRNPVRRGPQRCGFVGVRRLRSLDGRGVRLYFAGDGPNFFRTLATGRNPRRQKVFVTITDITTARTGGYVASKIALAGLSALFHGIFFAVIGLPTGSRSRCWSV
jgi:hypothetical protein